MDNYILGKSLRKDNYILVKSLRTDSYALGKSLRTDSYILGKSFRTDNYILGKSFRTDSYILGYSIARTLLHIVNFYRTDIYILDIFIARTFIYWENLFARTMSVQKCNSPRLIIIIWFWFIISGICYQRMQIGKKIWFKLWFPRRIMWNIQSRTRK